MGEIIKILGGENQRKKVYFQSTQTELLNPWGEKYTIYFDHDYDGVITTEFGQIKSAVAVWTPTKNGEFASSWE